MSTHAGGRTRAVGASGGSARKTTAERKAEVAARHAAYAARQDHLMNLPAGTYAKLDHRGYIVYPETDQRDNQVWAIVRTDDMDFRGTNWRGQGNTAGPQRLVYSPAEVARFADLVDNSPGAVFPRNHAAQEEIVRSHATGNTWVGRGHGLYREAIQALPDELAGLLSAGGRSGTTRGSTRSAKATAESKPAPATRTARAPSVSARATALDAAYRAARAESQRAVDNPKSTMHFHTAYQAEQQARSERDAFLASLSDKQRATAERAVARAAKPAVGTMAAPKRTRAKKSA